jgi:beta-carotene 3-hydroxylase
MGFLLILGTFIFMEFVAWFAHKYIMHGWFWHLHEDHHTKSNYGFFEKNDYFFVIFAAPAIILFVSSVFVETLIPVYIAIGITLYGAAYFFVHEIFIHQRFRALRKTNNIFFKAIRKAHKVHHKHLTKEGGECFGMFVVPWRFYKEAQKKNVKVSES